MIKTLDHFNRRDVLMAGAATAIGLGVSPMAFAQAAPKRGGRMRLGIAGANTGDSHDPATWGTSALVNLGMWAGVYNNLMEIGPDNKVVPELAGVAAEFGVIMLLYLKQAWDRRVAAGMTTNEDLDFQVASWRDLQQRQGTRCR